MDHREMKNEETTTSKLVPVYDQAMELAKRRDELEGVKKRMKKFTGEKEVDTLNLRELIALEKKLETLQVSEKIHVGDFTKKKKIHVGDMTLETEDIIVMDTYVKHMIETMDDNIVKPQDKFIIMEAFEKGRVKGLKMRMKVFIDEKQSENIQMEELIEINQKLEVLQPYKRVDQEMHMKDMTEEIKDIIIVKEMVKKMIAKKEGSSSKTMIIKNYYN